MIKFKKSKEERRKEFEKSLEEEDDWELSVEWPDPRQEARKAREKEFDSKKED